MTQNLTRLLGVCVIAASFSGATYYYIANQLHQQEGPNNQVRLEQHIPVVQTQQPEIIPNISSSEAEIDNTYALQSKLEAMQITIAKLQQEITEVKASQSSINESADIEPIQTTDADSMEMLKDKAIQEQYEEFLHVNSNFESEDIDASWSDTAHERIRNALYEEQTSELNIDNIDCRSTMCRLEINQMNSTNMEVFRDHFRHQVADVFGAGMIRQDDSGRTIVFLAKDDESF